MENNQPPIAAIIKHYGGMLKENYQSWQKIRCPFHKDSHASAGVCIADNIFVCHGCGIKGNPFNVIKEHEGVRYNEAIKIAEGITGEGYKSLRATPSLGRRVSSKARNTPTGRNSNAIRRSR